jgi:hemolysin III
MIITIKQDEKLSFYSHFIALLAAVAGVVYLSILTINNKPLFSVTLAYGVGLIFLFLSSSLYHACKKHDDEDSIFRKLDHFAIFVMIAGSYTPVSYVIFEKNVGLAIIITQWVLVLLGLIFKLFYLHAPRIIYTIIYLLMGWMVVIPLIITPFDFISARLPFISFIYMLTGGLAYTAGAIIYILKKPNISYFGFHEIFHLFIVIAGFLHFNMVYSLIAFTIGK